MSTIVESSFAPNTDIVDSQSDQVQLQPDEATLELPEVKDIPGQENIYPPRMREFADTTMASDDEEGVGIIDDEEDDADLDDDDIDAENDLTDDDFLEETGTSDESSRATLDDTDDDGDLLEERSPQNDFGGGDDLDVPGTELDDADEEIGEEDEENNKYSS